MGGRLEMPPGFIRRPVVFRAVDNPLHQRLIDLTKRHRRGVGAERFDHRHIKIGVLNANLHALHVVGRQDPPARIVKRTLAGIVIAKADQPMRFERGENALSRRAIERTPHMIGRAKEKRERRNSRQRLD